MLHKMQASRTARRRHPRYVAKGRSALRRQPRYSAVLPGHVSNGRKRGDRIVRHHLVTAATVLMAATKKWCPLKTWAIKIAKKQRFSKARVAVAPKLAIILHRMWINQQDFPWTSVPPEELEAAQAS
jgi:hypothetical protein